MKKRAIFIVFLFILSVVLLQASPSSARADEGTISTDAAEDGLLTAADAANMLRLLSLTPSQAKVHEEYDLTQNGSVNVSDVRAALMYACGEITDWVAFTERLSTGLLGESLSIGFITPVYSMT